MPPYDSIMRASYGSRNKHDKTQILALCLAKGVKLQRLLGGNPMNKIYFCPFLSVLECLHNYDTIMIVFFCFNQCLCQVRPLGQLTVIVDLILLKNRNFCAQENILVFNRSVIKYQFVLNKINIQISQAVLISQNFWSYRSIRNSEIAIVLF